MKDLHFDIYIANSTTDGAANKSAVWDALTKPEGVGKLYFGSRLVTTFKPGEAYQYIGPDGKGGETVHVEGEIVACEANRILQVTHRAGAIWRKSPTVFTSRLTYRFEDLGFATKLSIDHDQWMEGDPGHKPNESGWMLFLSSVKSYVETGKALDLPMH